MLYKAFISYSHHADAKRAEALHRALHRFTKPWYRLRALRVFRDQVNLSASPSLWSTIQEALDNSEFFILMASNDGAGSKWVTKEVEHWCSHKSPEKIQIVLTEGEIKWNETTNDDFDWEKTTALPKALSGKFEQEPLWVDLSWATKTEELSLSHSRFRDQLATLAAPLHGRSKEELDSEDVRENRKTRRLAKGAIASLAILTLSAMALAYLFYYQYRVALSRQLAVQANTYLDKQLDLALLLSVEAYQAYPTVEAKSSLLSALARSPSLTAFMHGHKDFVRSVAFNNDGSKLASASDDGMIIIWDAKTHQELGRLNQHQGRVNVVAFSPDGKYLVSGGTDQTLIIWDVERRAPLFQRRFEQPKAQPSPPEDEQYTNSPVTPSVDLIIFSPDGRKVAVYVEGATEVSLWDVPTGERVGAYEISVKDQSVSRTPTLSAISFIGGTERLAAYTELCALITWEAPGKTPGTYPLCDPMDDGHAAFSQDGQTLVVTGANGKFDLWSIAALPDKPKKIERNVEEEIASRAFSPDGKLIAIGRGSTGTREGTGSGEILIYSVETGNQVRILQGHSRDVHALAFSPDGKHLASGSHDRNIILWDLTGQFSLGTALPGTEALGKEPRLGHQVSISISPDGSRVAAFNRSGTAIEWEMKSGQPINAPVKSSAKWNAVAYRPDNVLRRISSDYKTLTVQEGQNSRSLELPQQIAPAEEEEESAEPKLGLAASEDGNVLAVRTPDGAIALWDLTKMERRGKAIEAQKNLMALTLSPDGGRLAAYDPEKKTAIAWDTITGEQKGSLALGGSKLGNMAFSVDGRTLAVGTEEDTIILWNIADGSQAQWSLTGDEKTPVRSIAFSRDGKSVAVGTRTRNGRIILFDITKGPLRSGVVLVSLDVIQDVAFDNEGSRLISTNYQGDVIVWDLDVGKWIQRALDKANLKLTAEEKRQLLN